MFTITSTSERVNSVVGLVLVGEVFPRFGLGRGLAFRGEVRRADRDVASMMTGPQVQDRNDFEDIEQFLSKVTFGTVYTPGAAPTGTVTGVAPKQQPEYCEYTIARLIVYLRKQS